MTIGERMREIRKRKKMTLEQVSQLTGISRPTINRYETGAISNIPSDKIEAISNALNVSPAEIMGWDEKPAVPNEELKFALFGGADDITDEMLQEVIQFAKMVKLREDNK